jgi:hypothetical protein
MTGAQYWAKEHDNDASLLDRAIGAGLEQQVERDHSLQRQHTYPSFAAAKAADTETLIERADRMLAEWHRKRSKY